jgi:hypothetical protein
MKLTRKLLACAIILAGLLAGMAAISTSSAGAAVLPVVYGTQANGWHAHTKPASIAFGMGGAPFITGLKWTSWGAGSAWGTGKLWTQTPGCAPSYLCAYHSRWVGVYLNVVKLRGTVRYYSRMSVEFFVSGKAHWDTGKQGTAGYWQFPAGFPYL